MFRLLTALATVVCVIQCTNANAQGPVGKWGPGGKWSRVVGPGVSMNAAAGTGSMPSQSAYSHRYNRGYSSRRSYYPSSSFGFSIGIGNYSSYGYPGYGYLDPYRFGGYGYDPYRYGSFRAPDLLNDPYFRESHRYDSRFPGRCSHRNQTPLIIRPAVPRVTGN